MWYTYKPNQKATKRLSEKAKARIWRNAGDDKQIYWKPAENIAGVIAASSAPYSAREIGEVEIHMDGTLRKSTWRLHVHRNGAAAFTCGESKQFSIEPSDFDRIAAVFFKEDFDSLGDRYPNNHLVTTDVVLLTASARIGGRKKSVWVDVGQMRRNSTEPDRRAIRRFSNCWTAVLNAAGSRPDLDGLEMLTEICDAKGR